MSNTATVYVTNNTGGNAIITFSHQYGSGTPEVWSPDPAQTTAPGENAGPLQVTFSTGLLSPSTDHWYCGVLVLDGPNKGTYKTGGSLDNPQKGCMLESADNGSTITFSVTTQVLVIPLNSGPCTSTMGPA